MKINISKKNKKDDDGDSAPLSARARMLTDLANLDDKDPKLAMLKA